MTVPLDFAKTLEALHLLTANEGLKKMKIECNLAATQQKNMEACYRECRRPWRVLGAFVGFDADKEQWKAEFQGVVAWGMTPEIACDNFDHLWMYG